MTKFNANIVHGFKEKLSVGDVAGSDNWRRFKVGNAQGVRNRLRVAAEQVFERHGFFPMVELLPIEADIQQPLDRRL
jgi:hypothetical protein